MRFKEIHNEGHTPNGRYFIRAMTYEQNHSPPHELRAFLSIPEVRVELEKLRYVIKNTPTQLLNKIPRSEIVNDLLSKHNFRISPRGKELIYNYLKGSDQYLKEESPDTLEGSFTEDLVESKKWLCETLKKIVGDKSAGKIYVPGSWYGNIGLYLQEQGINFDNLILIEKDDKLLDKSKEVLKSLFNDGKLTLMHTDAKDVGYEKPCTVINCSVNDMGNDWFSKVPKNSLVCLQARNNLENPITKTNKINDLDSMFPLSKTLYLKERLLKDPETEYNRYLKIGLK
jgi:hypothetical protein